MTKTLTMQNHSRKNIDRQGARARVLRLAMTLFAATLMTNAFAGESATSTVSARPCTQTTIIGQFTGKYFDGAPVYQLPSVSVVTTSRAELAKLLHDDREAETAHAKAAVKRPA